MNRELRYYLTGAVLLLVIALIHLYVTPYYSFFRKVTIKGQAPGGVQYTFPILVDLKGMPVVGQPQFYENEDCSGKLVSTGSKGESGIYVTIPKLENNSVFYVCYGELTFLEKLWLSLRPQNWMIHRKQ